MHADQNKAMQGEFFLKINKRACMSIRHTRVDSKNVSEKFKKNNLYVYLEFLGLFLVETPKIGPKNL